MVIEYSEQPTYILPQSKARAVFPQAVVLLILSSIFYLGILVNISLLELSKEKQQIAQAGTLVLLFCVILIGFLLAAKKAQAKYYFYTSRLVFQKKNIPYTAINLLSIKIKRDPFDKLFKTYTLEFNCFRMKNIPHNLQIKNYLEQLVNNVR